MYNEELKQKFLEHYSKEQNIETENNTIKIYKSLFNALEPYEIEMGDDICTAEAEQLTRILNYLVGLRTSGQRIKLSLLKRYTKWCVENKVPGAMYQLDKVKNDVFCARAGEMLFLNPLHVQKYLNSVFEPVENNSQDLTLRAYFWLAYAGMSEEDAISVKNSDIDLESMVVINKDNRYILFGESIPTIRRCRDLYYFSHNHGNYTTKLDRIESDMLLRGTRSAPSIPTMKVSISRKVTEAIKDGRTDMRMTFYNTWLSGLFYRTYVKEINGIKPDFSKVEFKQVSRKPADYKYKNQIDEDEKKRQLRRKEIWYMRDYENWKKLLNF